MPNLPAWWTNTTPNATGVNTLPGVNTFNYNPAYGGVPTVPSPGGTAADTITDNISNLGDLYKLSQGVTGISAADAAQAVGANLPGYQGMIDQSSANIGSLLKGQIPQDVLNLLSQQAAERGVRIGSPGSQNSMAALLRAMGLTSLGLQQQGESNLTGAIARTPTGPAFNPATMLTSPQDQQMWAYLARVLSQAPVPAAAAAANLNALNRGVDQGQGATSTVTSPAPIVAPPGGYAGPRGFGFNDLAPGSGGTPTAEDPNAIWDYIAGVDPETLAWMNAGQSEDDSAIWDSIAGVDEGFYE